MKTVKILYAPKCIKNAEALSRFFEFTGMLTYITIRERNQCEYDIFLNLQDNICVDEKYLNECINNFQLQFSKNEIQELLMIAKIYMKYNIGQHYVNCKSIMQKCNIRRDQEMIVEVQNEFVNAYCELSKKADDRTNLIRYAMSKMALCINETCRMLGDKLLIPTSKILRMLNIITFNNTDFVSAYLLEAEILEKFESKDVTEIIKICYEQAFSLIDESLEYASRLYCMRGHFLESIGDKKEALKDYKKALLLNPDECQAMLGIGNLLMFDGKYTSAELMFERILIRFSSDIGEEERCCIKRASEKLIALYGDLDFDSEEYKRIAEFAVFL